MKPTPKRSEPGAQATTEQRFAAHNRVSVHQICTQSRSQKHSLAHNMAPKKKVQQPQENVSLGPQVQILNHHLPIRDV